MAAKALLEAWGVGLSDLAFDFEPVHPEVLEEVASQLTVVLLLCRCWKVMLTATVH